MVLTFEVRIDVSDEFGKKQIPYLKHLLGELVMSQRIGKVQSVVCLDEMMPKEKAEAIEFEEWKSGRIDL